jgi:predicted GNAT family N-acyltransferase
MPSSTASRSTVQIQPITREADLFQALAIREVVFIEEQHVPEGIERDAEDAKAFHLLALQGGHAVGTGRLVMLAQAPDGESGTWAQIGRMAVLKSHRKDGVGSALLSALEGEARRQGRSGIVLHSQLYAQGFYERHGYHCEGAPFDEAGIQHITMKKRL